MKPIYHDEGTIYHGDCLKWMGDLKDKSVNLVFGSPPYEAQREYGELKFKLKGQDWVDWMVKVFKESLRICDGLVAFVVGHGVQEDFKWSATPALLLADLHRKGINLRNPKWFFRHGIPGTGGKDDLRKDVEWIVCATNGGKLPWANPEAMGKPWKDKVGGNMSFRTKTGKRVKQKTKQSEIANPGDLIKCKVGKGHMGSLKAHSNEAPFPESLANFFIRTFCPPNGIVLDPFGGSGTTLASAIKSGRKFITGDVRESQVKLMKQRYIEAKSKVGFGFVTN